MDLKHLKAFVSVAEMGSVSAASDRLRMAQPVLSRHIKRLEVEARVALFRRHDRGMELTDAGRELLKRIGPAIHEFDRALEDLHPCGKPEGQVTLGLFPSLIGILASRIIQRAALEYPGIALRVSEGFPEQLIGRLQRGEVDLALLIGPSADLHLRTTDLLYEEYLLVAAPGVQEDAPVSLSTLAQLPLIMPTPLLRSGHPLTAAAERAGMKLRIAYEIDSLPLTFDLVEAGLGYTVAPVSAISPQRDRWRFSTARLEEQVQRHLILAQPSTRTVTRATEAILDLVVAEVADLVRTGQWQAVPDSGLRSALGRT